MCIFKSKSLYIVFLMVPFILLVPYFHSSLKGMFFFFTLVPHLKIELVNWGLFNAA